MAGWSFVRVTAATLSYFLLRMVSLHVGLKAVSSFLKEGLSLSELCCFKRAVGTKAPILLEASQLASFKNLSKLRLLFPPCFPMCERL